MRPLREALILVICTVLAAAGMHAFHPRAPAWHLSEETGSEDEVTLEMVREKWHNDVIWIDARPRDQYEKGHVPGAILLNEQEAGTLLYEHFERLQDGSKPIVVYCDGAACQASHKMQQYLKDRLPVEDIFVLLGGWKAWQKSGGGEE